MLSLAVDESFIINSINAEARRFKRLAQPRIIGSDSANLNGFIDDIKNCKKKYVTGLLKSEQHKNHVVDLWTVIGCLYV